MSTTLENYAEQIAILCLQAQAGLSGFTVVAYDKDTAQTKDRIIVRALTRERAVPGTSGGTPPVWRIPLEITAHYTTRDASAFDAVIAEIEAAFADGTTPPAAAVALADAQFANGFAIHQTDTGSRDHGDETRERTRTFNVIART